jgi:hypothetical protein
MLIIGYSRAPVAPSAPLDILRIAAAGGANNTESVVLTLPAGIAAGNTLVAAFKIGGTTGGRTVESAPAGWRLAGVQDAELFPTFVYAKTADGSEGGGTASWTMSGTVKYASAIAEISGDRAVEVAFAEATYDPPPHMPAGGPGETAWLALLTHRGGGAEAVAAPSGYSGLVQSASSTAVHNTNANLALAGRLASAAAEDPGPFAPPLGVDAMAATISLR